jgi:hypothetical protein
MQAFLSLSELSQPLSEKAQPLKSLGHINVVDQLVLPNAAQMWMLFQSEKLETKASSYAGARTATWSLTM